MAPYLLTVEQAAELLNLHVKTVRRYVRDGRLKAKRIGKEYRIARVDLDEFTGTAGAADKEPVARTRSVTVSTIIDADVVSPESSDRITTLVLAALNSRKGAGDFPRLDSIYYPETAKLRIILTASPVVTAELLRVINTLLEAGHGGNL